MVGGGCLGSIFLCVVVSLVVYGSGVLGGTPQKVDTFAAFSPDGSQIAFTSRRKGNEDIFVVNADGTHLRQLTSNPLAGLKLMGDDYSDYGPAWSPDGKQIAFATSRNNTMWSYVTYDIYIMNADGSNLHPWYASSPHDNDDIDWEPAWSPDGKQIAFGSNRRGSCNIHVFPAEPGSGGGAVTPFYGNNNVAHPSWSPDGKRIVFSQNAYDSQISEILVVGADGSGPDRLTNLSASSTAAEWSPDGQKIVFHSNPGGTANIFSMNPDGTGLAQLTRDAGHNIYPSWSPDSRRIIFSSTRLGDDQVLLFVMDANGSNVVQLTK